MQGGGKIPGGEHAFFHLCLSVYDECSETGNAQNYGFLTMKMFYYRGLKEWNNEKGYLTDTCLTAQDKYKAYLDYFRIAY